MRWGLCTIAFREYPLATALMAAMEARVDGIELWGQRGHLPERFIPGFCEDLHSILKQHHLQLAVFGSYLRAGTEEFASQWEGTLQWAEGLEAPLVRVWAGKVGSQEADAGLWRRCVEDLRRLCEAAPHRRFVIERHENTLADRIEAVQRLLEEVGRENLGVNYQVASFEDTAAAVAGIEALSPRLWNVHAQNYGRDPQGRRVPWDLRSGEFDYRAILSTLKGIGFQGFVEVEFVRQGPRSDLPLHERRRRLVEEVEYLQQLLVRERNYPTGSEPAGGPEEPLDSTLPPGGM